MSNNNKDKVTLLAKQVTNLPAFGLSSNLPLPYVSDPHGVSRQSYYLPEVAHDRYVETRRVFMGLAHPGIVDLHDAYLADSCQQLFTNQLTLTLARNILITNVPGSEVLLDNPLQLRTGKPGCVLLKTNKHTVC